MKSKLIELLCLGVFAGVGIAQETKPPEAKPAESKSAEARFSDLRNLAAALKGVRGDERAERLRKLAAEFEEIARDFAKDPGTVARASYEAGEMWRRAGELAKSESAFAQCVATGSARYRERALFGRASMLFRLKKFDDSIGAFAEAAKVKPSSARAHESRIGVARCHAGKGDQAAAIDALRSAFEATDHAVRAIDASNRLARLLLEAKDLDGAQAAVEAARGRVESASGKARDRAQAAFDKMSVRRAIQRAVDKRDGAAKDAAELERVRRSGQRMPMPS